MDRTRGVLFQGCVISRLILFCFLGAVSVRAARIVPQEGDLRGGGLIFLNLSENAALGPDANVELQFGDGHPVKCDWDEKTSNWICTVPPHDGPGTLDVVPSINGKKCGEPLRYAYTTYGKHDVPVLEVSTKALELSAQAVESRVPPGIKIGVVLKNGDPVGSFARVFEDAIKVGYFCVPKLQDGIELRNAGIKAPIMILYVQSPENVAQMLHYDLEPAALSVGWVKRVDEILEKTNLVLNVHLWVDTGMGREGVIPTEALSLGRAITASSHLHLSGIGTHFGCIAPGDLNEIRRKNLKNRTVQQKKRFDDIIQALRKEGIGREAIIHAGTSEVLRNGLQPLYYDMLRIGSLFFENPSGRPKNYAWTTQLQQVKVLPPGWCLDYGCKKKTKRATKVGLVGHIPDRNGKRVFYIRDKRVEPLIDDGEDGMVVLDVSGIPDVREGERVRIEFDPESDSPLDSSLPVPVTLSKD